MRDDRRQKTEDRRRKTEDEKKGISNIEKGISNDEVRFFAALLTDKIGFDFRIFSPKICLIFPLRTSIFNHLRDLHKVGLFWEMT